MEENLDFPKKMSDEDMQLRRKEWRLMGVEVAMSRRGNTVVIFCLDHRRAHCEWVYARDVAGNWSKRKGHLPQSMCFCRYGKHVRHVCRKLGRLG